MKRFSLIFFSVFLIYGCSYPSEEKITGKSELAVSWELISNFVGENDEFDARFYIKNNGKEDLNDKDWAIFFNMAPRPILPNKAPQPARVEHINGDWYKLVPESGFALASGDSVEVRYSGTEGVIKETDAPLGLYVVHYDKEGNEKRIEQIGDATVLPFNTKEQLLRGKADQKPLPSASQRYFDNLPLRPLAEDELLNIIPSPVSLVKSAGMYTLDGTTIIGFGKGLENEASILSKRLGEITKLNYKTSADAARTAGITLKIGEVVVNGISKEAYKLDITKDGITIVGSDAAGVFYGIQSLLALIPFEAYGKKAVELSAMKIEDAPRFHTRGLHVDVSRNFQTKETILRTLDLMAAYKLNHFLLYTTEDEGWRLEIEGLPELTEVGGQRQHTSGMDAPALHPAYGSGPIAYEVGKHGSGYYTKADFVEILKYAAARHIKVIPEVNLPGHALAAIKAMEARYQRLMKEGKEKEANEYRLTDPDDQSKYLSAQGYKNNVVSVAQESTYRFYDKVVDEIAKMYQQAGLKMDVIHAGGDEVPEGSWTASPLAAKLMKENPAINDPKNLQAYFFEKLVGRMKKKGLAVHGWEEVALLKTADGSYQPNAAFADGSVVPYIWNNLFDYKDLGYRLANEGYPVILCNVSNFYFDMSYNNDPKEPGLYWAGFVDTRDNWEFAPYNMFSTTEETNFGKKLDVRNDFAGMEKLRRDARKNIIGVEAQLWSETVKGRAMMEYLMLPKLMGFAESAWAKARDWEEMPPGENRQKTVGEAWNIFANTLAARDLPKLSRLNGGYNYRIPLPGAIIEDGSLKANVALPGLRIFYTTNGTEPTMKSAEYSAPVKISGSVKLKAFDKSGRSGKSTSIAGQ
ncbi:family 20 glycosylhydrolase [Persicitalea jodogahamensis]|uniref:beta-N-acetylhexosaminidase n=1 Tax=Persicitalea jodogahamensis TaxID=402147 RepID=A0A8J3G9W3_9BACT|nr:family 20 glycosylhydrolase [Persicitalea jodogahamensis]GHB78323.1 beta-N-acetylhexosaminidase [Persicitalea jodogahamensis]